MGKKIARATWQRKRGKSGGTVFCVSIFQNLFALLPSLFLCLFLSLLLATRRFSSNIADGRNAGDNWSVSMLHSEILIIERKGTLPRFSFSIQKTAPRITLCMLHVVRVRYLTDKDSPSRLASVDLDPRKSLKESPNRETVDCLSTRNHRDPISFSVKLKSVSLAVRRIDFIFTSNEIYFSAGTETRGY